MQDEPLSPSRDTRTRSGGADTTPALGVGTEFEGTDEPEPPDTQLRPWEWPAAIIVGGVSVVFVALAARNLWFLSDAWDFLSGRDLTSLESYLRPHAGHLQSTTVATYGLLYEIFGLDFWPWYFIPRLLGYAAVAVFTWRVLRLRGADPVIAFGTLVIMLVLGVSSWHNLSTANNFVALAVLLGVAVIVSRRPQPVPADLVKVALLLTFSLYTTTLGLATWVGLLVALILTRRILAWWPPMVWTGALYGLWYLTFGRGQGEPLDLSLGAWLETPARIFELIESALPSILTTPDDTGIVVAVAAIGFVGWLGVRGKLTVFELTFLGTLLAFLGMIVLARIIPGRALPTAERYAFNVAMLLIPVVIPHIKLPRARQARLATTAAAILVMAVIAWNNLTLLENSLDFWEERSQESRATVEAAGALLLDGEPAFALSPIDRPRAGSLTVMRLQELLDEGWRPKTADPDVEEIARAELRLGIRPAGRIRGTKPITADTVDGNGCVIADSNGPVALEVVGTGHIRLDAEWGTVGVVTWTDGFGRGRREITFGSLFPDSAFVSLAEPPDLSGATMTVSPLGDRQIQICGVQHRGS